MLHVGDITKLHGDTLEAVDVVVGGSPCQDLSVAGLRAGLAGERCNGPGTARWASEIEEFPIAVTKVHFPEPGGGSKNASE